MKKLKFIVLIFLPVMILLTFCGCSYNKTGIDSLINPPKLSDKQANIYKALTQTVGNNIKLKYPKKGNFTSAFLIKNMNNDDNEEALVFYEMENANSSVKPLRISLMVQQDGKWVSTYETGVAANEIEKISFVTVEKEKYIVMGFNVLSSGEQLIEIYKIENNTLDEIYRINCVNYELCDLNNDNVDEIIAISKNKNSSSNVSAVMYKIISGGVKISSKTEMDPSVLKYENIIEGHLNSGEKALYFDGLKGTNTLTTEILTYQNKQLKNLIYNEEINLTKETLRSYNATSYDLQNDGTVEIPSFKVVPGYENFEEHLKLRYTIWSTYNNGNIEKVCETYTSYKMGYAIMIPSEWYENVSYEINQNTNEVTFFEYDKYSTLEDNKQNKIFSIKVIKKSEVEKNRDYEIIKAKGDLRYVAKIYNNSKIQVDKEKLDNLLLLL